jgi:hypothetical protein
LKKIDLGQSISILANLGVIAGIAFLAFELNQNNEQLSAQSRYNYYHERIEAQRLLASNGELADTVVKLISGDELSPEEQLRMTFFARSIFVTVEYEFIELQRERITLEEFSIPGKRKTFETLRFAWADYRSTAPEAFVEFVETEILR